MTHLLSLGVRYTWSPEMVTLTRLRPSVGIIARIIVAMSAAVVLVVTLVTPLSNAPAAVADEVSDLVPAIESPEVDLAPIDLPEGDFTDLGQPNAAAVQGLEQDFPRPAAEVPEVDPADLTESNVVSQDAYSTSYDLGDGYGVTEVSPVIQHVERDGEWVDISTTVTNQGEGTWGVEDHPLEPQFAPSADDEGAFAVVRDGYRVEFTLDDAASSPFSRKLTGPHDQSNEVIYEDVFDGVDLTYEVSNGEVKETLVLDAEPRTGENSWSWTVDAEDLTLVDGVGRSIDLIGADDEPMFTIPRPMMWDSSAVEGVQEAAEIPLGVDYEQLPSGAWRFTVTADEEWLGDSERVYPVYVDPTTHYYGDSNVRAYKSDGASRTDGVLVGNSRNGGGNYYWRSFVRYPYATTTDQVLRAWIEVGLGSEGTSLDYTGGVYTRLSGCTATNYYTCRGTYLDPLPVGTSGTTPQMDGVANRVSALVNGNVDNVEFMLGGREIAAYTYKFLETYLYVVYADYPTVTHGTVDEVTGTLSTATTTPEAGPEPVLNTISTDPADAGLSERFVISTNSSPTFSDTSTPAAGTVIQSNWIGENGYQVPPGTLQVGTTYYWRAQIRDAYDPDELEARGLPANYYYGTPAKALSKVYKFIVVPGIGVVPRAGSAPGDDSMLTELTPTLTTSGLGTLNSTTGVWTASGQTVKFQFRIATGGDGLTGQVSTSGWIDNAYWTVPDGILSDGGSYTWSVTAQGSRGFQWPDWANSFTVNRRLGTSGPQPMDTAGPVAVNLASGNVAVSFSSPTVSTLGGPMGMSFSFNSEATSNRGLVGSYFDATPNGSPADFDFDGKVPSFVRTDSTINFSWPEVDEKGSPGPGLESNKFLVKWEGYIRPASTGTWYFGVKRDNGVRVWVNNTQIINKWDNGVSTNVYAPTPVTLSSTSPVPIRIEYYDNTGNAAISLWQRKGTTGSFAPVQANQLTKNLTTLPPGWEASTPLAGAAGTYSSAKKYETFIVLTDAGGGSHVYLKKKGGYKPPKGEYGSLSLDDDKNVVLTELDGTVYQFNKHGKIANVTSPVDAKNPAMPVPDFDALSGRVTKISDPLSVTTPGNYAREVLFTYKGCTSNCPTDTAKGYVNPPGGMLCKITYPSVNGQTQESVLYYNSNGQLASILDPGAEQTSFGYDNNGQLRVITDSLGNDWLGYVNPDPPIEQVSTVIEYEKVGSVYRATSVTLPAPDGASAARPKKSYSYSPTTGQAYVDVDGLSAGVGNHNVTVGFDSAWRQTSTTSAMEVQATQTWTGKDLLVRKTDVNRNLVSTTRFDALDRATDTYGPAHKDCFSTTATDPVPLSSCDITPAHTRTDYDAGLHGLNAVYYANDRLSGAPTKFALGLGSGGTGGVDHDWSTMPPLSGTADNRWSMRLNGVLAFPADGQYDFKIVSADAGRFVVDSVEVVDYWSNGPATESQPGAVTISGATSTTPALKRVRFEFANRAGPPPCSSSGGFQAPHHGFRSPLRRSSPTTDSRIVRSPTIRCPRGSTLIRSPP